METVPPRPDEFEISIFGPGKGECILIHLGNNEWCVVDSCIARGRTDSVAMEYLRSFDNDALPNVRLVVATHWHDDHIGGLASLLAMAPNAAFCCSMALQQPEFLYLVFIAPKTITGRSGVDEFASILKELDARGQRAPIFAVENKQLLSLSGTERPFPITLETLSPANPTIRLALSEIASLIPGEGEPQRRIVNRSPNHASVVLWVRAGPVRVLLGADLQQTGRKDEGWSAVVACHQDHVPGHLFKVPHHGSTNSDHPDVWDRMLTPDQVAVVTPFSGGRVRLPKDSDLERLSERTPRLYCTAASLGKPPKRDALVEKAMRRQLSERRILAGQPGHVRVRWSATEDNPAAQIETFNGAYHFNPTIS
jgi:hypothetical protein